MITATKQIAGQVQMLACFGMDIFIPLLGDNKDAGKVHANLKNRGARIGYSHVKALLEGQEQSFKGFEVVTVSGHTVPQEANQQPAPVRRPMIAPTGPQVTKQTSPAPVARGRGREYPASGDIKPLKRGTTYAVLMEMLLQPAGASMKELLEAAGNQTSGGVNDVLSWQIKQRGYGLRFDQTQGKYHLVLPNGHKALTYKD